jgi:hypothetical protein
MAVGALISREFVERFPTGVINHCACNSKGADSAD